MSLGDRLQAARHAHFVGRAEEVARFREIVAAETLPVQVVLVHGPGGVGKTTLLYEFAYACREAGVPVGRLDARTVDATPEALAQALAGAEPGETDARRVLLVDTLESIGELELWLRDVLLPTLDDDLLVVLAGRQPPAGPWRTDPGWADLVASMPIRNLSPAESRDFLRDQGLPDAQHDSVIAFARGYPLALALAAEDVRGRPGATFDAELAPQAVGPLVNRFLAETAEDDVREAVQASSLARVVTQSLLAHLLGRPVSDDLFARVRRLPIVEDTAGGIALHALALDVIATDLRWRQPDRYAALHERARQYYTGRLQRAHTPESQREVLADYAFLFRDAPVAGALIGRLREAMRGGGALSMGPARPSDRAAVLAMTERHEGAEAARLAAHWLDRQPERFVCVRDADGAAVGYLGGLFLDAASASDRAADPVAEAAWAALRQAAPRDGQRVLLFRCWMDAEAHQGVSPVQALLFARTVWDYLTTPDLAVSILMCAAPHAWEPILGFAGLAHQPDADAQVGDVAYQAYLHDWRLTPPDAWLRELATRAPMAVASPTAPAPAPPLVVLSEDDFGDAVREALKGLVRASLLLESDLLHSRLVADRVPPDADDVDRAQALAALLRDTIEQIEAERHGDRYRAALETMYVRPAPSQAIAAERLDLPFSTFRRHLARGIGLVVDALWTIETR